MSFYPKDLKEEALKQRVANDFFALLKMTKSTVFASFDDIKVCKTIKFRLLPKFVILIKLSYRFALSY